MIFSQFADYLNQLESQPSRLAMTEILSKLFKELEKQEVKRTCYLLQGTLVPAYESLEFQLSTKMIIRAIAQSLPVKVTEPETLFGTDEQSRVVEVEKAYKKLGDLGETAYQIKKESNLNSKLTILDVYSLLAEIATENGQGSQQRKLDKLQLLLDQVDGLSAKYIVRIILGKLRLGFSTMTMIDGLSWAVTGGKSHRKLLEDAYQKQADIGSLAEFYLKKIKLGDSLNQVENHLNQEYRVVVGVPVVPALCQRLNSAAEIIEKMKEVYVEPKYDGLRVQVHFSRKLGDMETGKMGNWETGKIENLETGDVGRVKIFTRNLEEVTHMFPEVDLIGKFLNCDSAIFDGEAIGYDPKTNKLLPFQATITRKRKHGIETVSQDVPLKFFMYDLLSLDGKELIHQPLSKRKKLLDDCLQNNQQFVKAPYIITDNADELRDYHLLQLKNGLEGAVVKQIEAEYQSGRKGWSWVKIKESEGTSGKLTDTVDAVIMGYFLGRGSRAKFGLGAILVGINKKDTGEPEFVTLTKVGTGMTEAQLSELKALLEEFEVAQKPDNYLVHKNLQPDIWVKPSLVIEIAADEITKSPTHTAGWALRFPRLIKIRTDKNPENATTLDELDSIKIA